MCASIISLYWAQLHFRNLFCQQWISLTKVLDSCWLSEILCGSPSHTRWRPAIFFTAVLRVRQWSASLPHALSVCSDFGSSGRRTHRRISSDETPSIQQSPVSLPLVLPLASVFWPVVGGAWSAIPTTLATLLCQLPGRYLVEFARSCRGFIQYTSLAFLSLANSGMNGLVRRSTAMDGRSIKKRFPTGFSHACFKDDSTKRSVLSWNDLTFFIFYIYFYVDLILFPDYPASHLPFYNV